MCERRKSQIVPPLHVPQSLHEDGVITVRVCTAGRAAQLKVALRQAVDEFPEFVPGANRLVLGSFGALGNPSSFHHPLVRHCRMLCARASVGLFRRHIQAARKRPQGRSRGAAREAQTRRLELLWDRVCWRRQGDFINFESPHRDVAAHALPTDEVFGGWLNLDSESQYFTCIPGSQFDVSSGRKGCCTERVDSRDTMRRIEVPPGHEVVFFQQILHEVPKGRIDHDSFRLFVGWRLTDSESSLQDRAAAMRRLDVPTTETLLHTQGVPLLPSGQRAPMYAKTHIINWPAKLKEWADASVVSQCKVWTVVRGKRVHLPPRYLSSLKELGLPLYPPYEEEERSVMSPSTSWTFEGRELFLHRRRPQARRLRSPKSELHERGDCEVVWRGAHSPTRGPPRRGKSGTPLLWSHVFAMPHGAADGHWPEDSLGSRPGKSPVSDTESVASDCSLDQLIARSAAVAGVKWHSSDGQTHPAPKASASFSANFTRTAVVDGPCCRSEACIMGSRTPSFTPASRLCVSLPPCLRDHNGPHVLSLGARSGFRALRLGSNVGDEANGLEERGAALAQERTENSEVSPARTRS